MKVDHIWLLPRSSLRLTMCLFGMDLSGCPSGGLSGELEPKKSSLENAFLKILGLTCWDVRSPPNDVDVSNQGYRGGMGRWSNLWAFSKVERKYDGYYEQSQLGWSNWNIGEVKFPPRAISALWRWSFMTWRKVRLDGLQFQWNPAILKKGLWNQYTEGDWRNDKNFKDYWDRAHTETSKRIEHLEKCIESFGKHGNGIEELD